MSARVLAAFLLWPTILSAQTLDGGINVQLFRPVSDAQGGLVTADSEVLGHLEPNASVWMSFARNPLELAKLGQHERIRGVVDGVTTLEVAVALGLSDLANAFVGLPLTLSQDRSGPLFAEDESVSGVNDLYLGGKLDLLQGKDNPLGAAVMAVVSLPTGAAADFLGAKSANVELVAVGDVEPMADLKVAANLGYRLRTGKTAKVGVLAFDDQLLYRLAVVYALRRVEVIKRWEVLAELWGSTVAKKPFKNERQGPVELSLGLRRPTGDGLVFTLGLGIGLSEGIGSPDYRAILGLVFYPFQEESACAAAAPCPSCPPCRPETIKVCEFEGEEDADGYQDEDGCPDPDNDHDGILDINDKCPNDAEDKDGFEDEDGCPEPDNDADGVVDVEDRCPLDAEDPDGFEDEDGCPELDNDHDRIVDAEDQCPNEPEDIDTFEDHDGCPEEGKGRVAIVGKKIEILDKVYFQTASAQLDVYKSAPILDSVSTVLTNNPWVLLVEVQGHTDDRGSDASNLELSQRRAESVTAYLVQKGVAASRLQAKGYGEAIPIQANVSRRGRAANRRVEFLILKTEGGDQTEIRDGDSGQIILDDENP